MIEQLKHPVNGAAATAAAVLGALNLDVLFVIATWGWTNLGQVFYMATLFVSSSSVLPVTQQTAATVVAVLALLLLLKLGLKAHEQIDKKTDDSQ